MKHFENRHINVYELTNCCQTQCYKVRKSYDISSDKRNRSLP